MGNDEKDDFTEEPVELQQALKDDDVAVLIAYKRIENTFIDMLNKMSETSTEDKYSTRPEYDHHLRFVTRRYLTGT